MKPKNVNNFHTDIWPPSAFTWPDTCPHTSNEPNVPTRERSVGKHRHFGGKFWRHLQGRHLTRFVHPTEVFSYNAESLGKYFATFRRFAVTFITKAKEFWESLPYAILYVNCQNIVILISQKLLSLLLLSSSSSSPLCRVFILIFLRQTMSLGNTVLQLFCCYYSWCLYR